MRIYIINRNFILKFIALVGVIFNLTACSLFSHHSKVELTVGMSKSDVVKIMGTPQSVSAQGPMEYLVYPSSSDNLESLFYVRLVNDTVESFGDKDYYGHIRIKTPSLEGSVVDKSVTDLLVKNPGDAYNNLLKLKGLLDNGVITQAEYEEQKVKLLAQ